VNEELAKLKKLNRNEIIEAICNMLDLTITECQYLLTDYERELAAEAERRAVEKVLLAIDQAHFDADENSNGEDWNDPMYQKSYKQGIADFYDFIGIEMGKLKKLTEMGKEGKELKIDLNTLKMKCKECSKISYAKDMIGGSDGWFCKQCEQRNSIKLTS